jgi:hypothetical protein
VQETHIPARAVRLLNLSGSSWNFRAVWARPSFFSFPGFYFLSFIQDAPVYMNADDVVHMFDI